MADQFRLSLKPKGARTDDSIPFLIQQISSQRGSFGNVTERELENEIAIGLADQQGDGEEFEENAEKPEADDIQARRNEILTQAQYIQPHLIPVPTMLIIVIGKPL